MMRRLLLTLLMPLALIFTIMPALPAAAVDVFPNCGAGSANGTPAVCNDTKSTSGNPAVSVIKDAINILSVVIGVAAVILMIVGGLRLVGSAGDPQAAASARGTIIAALIGVVIAAIAQTLVIFVLDRLT